jgi:oxygen-independent coproporphyrinogen-3 oxidase
MYIHIPFCSHICSYCDFCKRFYNEKECSNYLDSLSKEIKDNYKGEKIKTIYIGGGTPSSLSINNLTKLFNILKDIELDNDYEFTIEVNPENIDEEKLKLFKSNRVNRISIGIESTNDVFLKYLNRKHDFKMVKDIINLIKQYFININVDLIYAIPNETINDLKNDLDNIIDLDINHVSTYSLIINENTVLGINKTNYIDNDLDREMYDYICNYLKEHHFNHYEISNFSKNGYESRHNLVYWHNENYYGFGLGASGYINNIRYDNTKSLSSYLKGNYLLNREELNKEDIMSYHLILGFRLIKGINKKVFYNKYNVELIDMYNIKDLINKGYLIDDGENIKIKYDMIYVENKILENFI